VSKAVDLVAKGKFGKLSSLKSLPEEINYQSLMAGEKENSP